MNERIKQLAEQAAISCGYFIGPRLYMTHEEEMEKFAELIVRECVETLGTYENTWTHEEQMTLLKKHFGVES
jgi:hypothetical protein